MGKLKLSHIQNTRQPSSHSRPESQPSSRFGSLVDVSENPFKVASQDARRNRRRRQEHEQPHTNQEQTNKQSNNDDRNNNRQQGGIASRQSRIPVIQLKEDTLFPELETTNYQSNTESSIKSSWIRSGIDVISSTDHMSVQPIKNGDDDDSYIRPGWVRISRRGIEYGPPSDNYERVLATNRRTQYVIHKEFLMRNKRIANDNRDIYGEDTINIQSAISDDDETRSDDSDTIVDGNFSEDDESKKGNNSDDDY